MVVTHDNTNTPITRETWSIEAISFSSTRALLYHACNFLYTKQASKWPCAFSAFVVHLMQKYFRTPVTKV